MLRLWLCAEERGLDWRNHSRTRGLVRRNGGPTGPKSVAEDLDVGAEGIQPVGQILITTIDDIDVPQLGLPTSSQHAQQDAYRGSKRRRAHHLLTAPTRWAFHNDS